MLYGFVAFDAITSASCMSVVLCPFAVYLLGFSPHTIKYGSVCAYAWFGRPKVPCDYCCDTYQLWLRPRFCRCS